MIDRNNSLIIAMQAKVLGMSCSFYVLPARPTGQADLALMRLIDQLHMELLFMGARQLRRELIKAAYPVGRRVCACP